MDITINSSFEKQIHKMKNFSNDTFNRIINKIKTIDKLEEDGESIEKYLFMQNGKKMRGGKNKSIEVFKFRISDGERIIYWKNGSNIELLSYISSSKHDDQGKIANRKEYYINDCKSKNIKMLLADYDVSDDVISNLDEDELEAISLLHFSNGFKGYKIPESKIGNLKVSELDKYLLLSEKQAKIIDDYKKKPKSTLIIGGAGTGKTLIAVHLLNSIINDEDGSQDKKIIYFTQTEPLLKRVEGQYSKLNNGQNNNIEFKDINDYCLETLSKKRKTLCLTRNFKEDFFNKHLSKTLKDRCQKEDISVDVLWTEIRGTLKGGLQDWTRFAPINQNNFNFNIRHIEGLGIIKRLQKNPKLFVLKKTLEQVDDIIKNGALSNKENETLKEIKKHFSTFDCEKTEMDYDYYLSLDDEKSLLSNDKRGTVIEIYEEYKKYLKENNLLDENDLVREVLKNNIEGIKKQFDVIFVDEVQDYTELQIYLINQLCKNKYQGMIYAGDVHQIINPTLFSIENLKAFYRDENNNVDLDVKFLNKNYRCQQGIIDTVNGISDLRRKCVGLKDKIIEEQEESHSSAILTQPYRLKYNNTNIKRIVKEASKYPQVAVLVPNNKTKEYLLTFLENLDHNFIFTVDEIKGMEYEYVICFNLIYNNQSIWDEILNNITKDKRTQYRYYFNLLYVATSRAQECLCFIDESTNEILEQNLSLELIKT